MSILKRNGNVLTTQDQIDIRRDIALGTAALADVPASGNATSAQTVLGSDTRLTDAREWTAATVTQVDAEAGIATSRVAWTVTRVWQAVAAYWNSSSAKTKLDGIAAGATVNSTDAQLRDRATHTGTQAISTVTGLQTALDGKEASGATTAAMSAHTGAANPHSQYVLASSLGTASIKDVPATGDATTSQVVLGTDTRLTNAREWSAATISQAAAEAGSDTSRAAWSAERVKQAILARIGLASINDLVDVNVATLVAGQVLKWNGTSWGNATDDTASGGGATNLGYVQNAAYGTVTSSSGASATLSLADATYAGLMTPAQVTKLSGIATGATANSSDAVLLARANHTGTQAISTVSGLQAALDAKATAASLATVATTGAYADLTGKPSLGTSSGLDVPATGDAAVGQVVKGSDTRLSDARTPLTHVHTAGQVTGLATVATTGAYADLSGKPTLGTSSTLDVPASGDATSTQVVKGTDTRLTDAREWTGATIAQAEAEAGTATTRRAWTAERVLQAILAALAASTAKILRNYKETLYSVTTSGPLTLDLANGNVQKITMGGAHQITAFSTPGSSVVNSCLLHIDCNGYTPTWSGVTWVTSDHVAPTLNTTAGKNNMITLTWGGSKVFGAFVGSEA